MPSVHQSHRATPMRSRHTDPPDNTILEPRRLWLGATESALVGTEKKSSEALNCRGISCNRPACLAVMLPMHWYDSLDAISGFALPILASVAVVARELRRRCSGRTRQGRTYGQCNSIMARPLLRKHSCRGEALSSRAALNQVAHWPLYGQDLGLGGSLGRRHGRASTHCNHRGAE